MFPPLILSGPETLALRLGSPVIDGESSPLLSSQAVSIIGASDHS